MKNRLLRILAALVLILGAIGLGSLDLEWQLLIGGDPRETVEYLRNEVQQAGALRYLLILLLFALLPLVLVPHSAICVVTALLFRPLPAILMILAGSLLNTAIGFWLARDLGRAWVEKAFSGAPRLLQRMDEGSGSRGWMLALMLRCIPMPFAWAALAAGLSRIRFSQIAGATIALMIPWSIFFTIFVESILEGSGKKLALSILLVAVLVATAWTLAARAKKRTPDAPTPETLSDG